MIIDTSNQTFRYTVDFINYTDDKQTTFIYECSFPELLERIKINTTKYDTIRLNVDVRLFKVSDHKSILHYSPNK